MGLVCPLEVLLLLCRSSLCLHPEKVLSLWYFYRESLFLLVFLLRIIMAATVTFGMPYACRICSIFPLSMESKTLVKSINSIVACRFFLPKGICIKVNVIVLLKYELTYYNSAVHHFNHYTTGTPPKSSFHQTVE